MAQVLVLPQKVMLFTQHWLVGSPSLQSIGEPIDGQMLPPGPRPLASTVFASADPSTPASPEGPPSVGARTSTAASPEPGGTGKSSAGDEHVPSSEQETTEDLHTPSRHDVFASHGTFSHGF